jgi:hypothetical protein
VRAVSPFLVRLCSVFVCVVRLSRQQGGKKRRARKNATRTLKSKIVALFAVVIVAAWCRPARRRQIESVWRSGTELNQGQRQDESYRLSVSSTGVERERRESHLNITYVCIHSGTKVFHRHLNSEITTLPRLPTFYRPSNLLQLQQTWSHPLQCPTHHAVVMRTARAQTHLHHKHSEKEVAGARFQLPIQLTHNILWGHYE